VTESRPNAFVEFLRRGRARLEALFVEYGKTAIATYFVIFGLVLAGFAIAIQQGADVQSAHGSAGVLAGAWVATKVTQPLRIAATLLLTPIVARVLRKSSAPSPTLPDEKL
jgi:hypothetical protein